MKAVNSHLILLQELKEHKNCDIDVYISSYTTRFDTDLVDRYTSNLIGSNFNKDLIGMHNLIHNAIKCIKNISMYNFVLIMRIDLYLKDHFIKIFDPNWNKILFPSICFKPNHKVGNHPRVNDMMLFFPQRYYKYLSNILFNPTGHNLWRHLINNTNLEYKDLDTMINTYHDSDSAKDHNPLYYVVNRHVCNIQHTKDELFDKFNFT